MESLFFVEDFQWRYTVRPKMENFLSKIKSEGMLDDLLITRILRRNGESEHWRRRSADKQRLSALLQVYFKESVSVRKAFILLSLSV